MPVQSLAQCSLGLDILAGVHAQQRWVIQMAQHGGMLFAQPAPLEIERPFQLPLRLRIQAQVMVRLAIVCRIDTSTIGCFSN
jgi:hypothetical protein